MVGKEILADNGFHQGSGPTSNTRKRMNPLKRWTSVRIGRWKVKRDKMSKSEGQQRKGKNNKQTESKKLKERGSWKGDLRCDRKRKMKPTRWTGVRSSCGYRNWKRTRGDEPHRKPCSREKVRVFQSRRLQFANHMLSASDSFALRKKTSSYIIAKHRPAAIQLITHTKSEI